MGVIMHNNIPYGGGSTIEPNPQESATEQLEKLGIDGDVYEVTDANAAREVQQTITETQSRTNLANGDDVPTIFGKIKKWFSDLKDLAFIGKDGASSTKYLRGDGTWQNFPTIPTVNDATLTIQKNGTAVETFTANSSTNKTANITVPEVGETDTTNSTPYLYRASQNSGDRCYLRQLVGASFGVNQINNAGKSIKNGQYTDTRNYFDLNLRQTYSPYTELFRTSLSSAKTISTIISSSATFAGFSLIHNGSNRNLVLMSNSDGYIINGHKYFIFMQVVSADPTTVNGLDVENFNFIDLTQMFGTAIADKAYTMEQTTAGSGIAWLKSYGFFTESYYPYNTGSLQSVNTSGKVCWGKNRLNATPKTSTAAGITYNLLNDNFLTVKGTGTGNSDFYFNIEQITFHRGETWHFGILNLNGNFNSNDVGIWLGSGHARYLGTITASNGYHVSYTFTNDETYDVVYYRHYLNNTPNYSANMYLAKVQLTSYESYESHTTPISPIDLRGVPKLVDNNIVYDGDVMDESGRIDRKTIRYHLKDLDWNMPTTGGFQTRTAPQGMPVGIKPMICGSKLVYYSYNFGWSSFSQLPDKGIFKNNSYAYLYVKDTAYTTLDAFVASLDGVYIDVLTDTVVSTEQTTPIQNPEIYSQFGWEQFIDDRNYPIPVGHYSEYVNFPDWLEDGYYKDFRQRVDETLPNAISALANTAVKVIAKKGQYEMGVRDWVDMPDCSLSLDKGTYLIMGWCNLTGDNYHSGSTYYRYGCAIADSSNNRLVGNTFKPDSNQAYEASISTCLLETITTDATVRKLKGYMGYSSNSYPIKGGIAAFKLS